MSRPQRNRSGANKPRTPPAKRPAGQAGAKPTAKPTAKPAAEPAGKPAAKAAAEPAGKGAAASGPAAPVTRPAPAKDECPSDRSGWVADAALGVVLVTFFGLFVLGLVVGAAGAFVHGMKISAGGATLPTGTLLGVSAAGGVAFCAGVLTRSRLGAVTPAAGWLISALLLAQPRPEGDVLIGGAAMDYGYMVGGLALLLAVSALPYGLLDRDPAADVASRSR